MKKAFFLVTLMMLLLLPAVGWATDWYVRPAGGSYGTEDGSSYDNAFDGFSNVSGLSSGDTLWVCGTHRETLTVNWSNATIRLDYPSNPGVIYGSNQIDGDDSGWSGPDANGEYSISLTTECNVVAKDGIIMTPGTVGSLGSNEWDWDSNTLYIGSNPSGHTFEVGQRNHVIQFPDADVSNFTIIGNGKQKQILFANKYGIATINDVTTRTYGNLTVRDVWFDGCTRQAVHVDAINATWDTIVVKGCRITQNGAEGIYLRRGISTAINVSNNIIGAGTYDNFGWYWDGVSEAIDGDGIDTYYGFSSTITNNLIQNISGDGIIAKSNDLVIADNIIINPGTGRTTKSAIRVDPQEASGNEYIEHNHIIIANNNVDGITLNGASSSNVVKTVAYNLIRLPSGQGNAISSDTTNSRYNKVYNNTIINGDNGFYLDGENPISSEITNNIFYNTAHHVYSTKSDLSGLSITYNDFYPVGSSNNFYVSGTTYTTLSAFESAIGTVSDNMDSDSKLSSTYQLSHNSPCINAGATISGFHETAKDRDGQPITGIPDIGCDERKALWWDGRRWHMQRMYALASTPAPPSQAGYMTFVDGAGINYKNTGGITFQDL